VKYSFSSLDIPTGDVQYLVEYTESVPGHGRRREMSLKAVNTGLMVTGIARVGRKG
jgi:hypothetical protein